MSPECTRYRQSDELGEDPHRRTTLIRIKIAKVRDDAEGERFTVVQGRVGDLFHGTTGLLTEAEVTTTLNVRGYSREDIAQLFRIARADWLQRADGASS